MKNTDLFSLGALALMAACSPVPSEKPNGRSLFESNCVACHGETGRGDGPAAAGLYQTPANLRQIAARNGGVFPADDVLAKVHGYGGPGHFGDMPDFGRDMDGPKTIWTTEEGDKIATSAALVALVRYVESLQD